MAAAGEILTSNPVTFREVTCETELSLVRAKTTTVGSTSLSPRFRQLRSHIRFTTPKQTFVLP
jgi:hypothetical protein